MHPAVQRITDPFAKRRGVLVRRLGVAAVALVGTTLTLPSLVVPAAAGTSDGQTASGCPGFSASQGSDPSQSGGEPSTAWGWSGNSSPGSDNPGPDTDGESHGCPELVTVVSPTTIVYGQTVTDTASFQADPQGDVAFFVCSASAANCVAQGTFVGVEALQADDSGGSSVALTYKPPAVGSYCFFDVFHNADGTVPESADDSAECFTVTPPPLVITASSGTLTYGGPVPTITPSYSGFVNGDTPATALTTPPTCGTTATSASPVGTYPSTCSGAVAPNYTITYVPGTVNVLPAPLTITASSGSMTTGGKVPAITPIYGGFVNGETAATALAVPPTCGTTATSASPVGTYPSTCSGAVASNYAISYFPGQVTVTASPPTAPASGSQTGAGAAAPSSAGPPTAPTSGTPASPSPVSKATTVHTGEPWAGARPLQVDAEGLGILLVALGMRRRRRWALPRGPRRSRG
jgi:hypothetical protein